MQNKNNAVRGEFAWPFGDLEADLLDVDNTARAEGGNAVAAELDCEEGYLGQKEYDKYGMERAACKNDLKREFMIWMNEDFDKEYAAHVAE